MRIQFEIKESLINILDQLMHSDFWATEIKEDESGKKIIKIKDLAYNLEAVAEVMGNEIFIKTALSKYTYRIYEVKGECWCEYVGAYRGFLEQKLLPIITPKENLLECEVLDSSILGGKQKTLREYADDPLLRIHYYQNSVHGISLALNYLPHTHAKFSAYLLI